jgi:ribosome-binding factor A
MSSRRALKLAEAVRQVVSSAILFELKDPRVCNVTVTYVEVADDLRSAKVHVSVMGDEKKQQLTLRGLQNAAGFLQSRCAEKIETRWTPRLQFILDKGVKHSIEISRILSEVLPPKPSDQESANAPEGESSEAGEESGRGLDSSHEETS